VHGEKVFPQTLGLLTMRDVRGNVKKEDRDFLIDCLTAICSKLPPQKDNPKNTVIAYQEFIEVPGRPPPFDKNIWLEWIESYMPDSTPTQISKTLIRKVLGKTPGKIFKFILPKDPFKYLREANEIFFDPDSLLKRFNIDLPSGVFTLDLIFYLRRDKTMIRWMKGRPHGEADKRLRKLLRHCLGILLSIEAEFFRRFKKEKKSHRKAIDILFGGHQSD
jgi:hypothetical protein